VLAAEVMRQDGDLDSVCDATGETEAYAVLAAWDGRSDKDSVGTHIFEEFAARLPAEGVWLTPFSPADPMHPPRDLNTANPQVTQAMQDAIDAIRDAGSRSTHGGARCRSPATGARRRSRSAAAPATPSATRTRSPPGGPRTTPTATGR
jgi:acyl-homoserine lactone acylase PvdQ